MLRWLARPAVSLVTLNASVWVTVARPEGRSGSGLAEVRASRPPVKRLGSVAVGIAPALEPAPFGEQLIARRRSGE